MLFRSVPAVRPPVMVMPDSVLVPTVIVKMRKLVAAAGSRRTVKSPAPGPLIVTGLVMFGKAVSRVIA